MTRQPPDTESTEAFNAKVADEFRAHVELAGESTT
jgi:hypothetical protein